MVDMTVWVRVPQETDDTFKLGKSCRYFVKLSLKVWADYREATGGVESLELVRAGHS